MKADLLREPGKCQADCQTVMPDHHMWEDVSGICDKGHGIRQRRAKVRDDKMARVGIPSKRCGLTERHVPVAYSLGLILITPIRTFTDQEIDAIKKLG